MTERQEFPVQRTRTRWVISSSLPLENSKTPFALYLEYHKHPEQGRQFVLWSE